MWDLIVSVPDHCLSFYFVESDHEIISIFSLPLIQRRAVAGYWRKYMYVLSVQVTAKE